MRAYLLLLLIPSVAMLFLPYTFSTSPWAVASAREGWLDWDDGAPLALLGFPFFLSIPILIAQTRLVLKRAFSKVEGMTYGLLASAPLGAGLAVLGNGFRKGVPGKEDMLWVSVYSILYAGAVWTMILSARKLRPQEATTVMLRAAWLPNAIYCAIAFWGSWQIGAYLAAFTILLYTTDITLTMRRRRQPSGA